MERRYTLSEIDSMRAALRKRIPGPSMVTYRAPAGGSAMTMDSPSRMAMDSWEHAIEDQLRTALIAGIDPSELVEPEPQIMRAFVPAEEVEAALTSAKET